MEGAQIVVKSGAAPLAQNESNLCQPSLYGNGERAGGALLDTSARSCYGLMRLQKVAHLLHRLDPEVLRLFPGIDRHFRLRRQRRDIHGDGVCVAMEQMRCSAYPLLLAPYTPLCGRHANRS